jgi:hypothetical protein
MLAMPQYLDYHDQSQSHDTHGKHAVINVERCIDREHAVVPGPILRGCDGRAPSSILVMLVCMQEGPMPFYELFADMVPAVTRARLQVAGYYEL